MHPLMTRLINEETGADATEYALLAALIAVALIVGANFLGGRINALFNGLGTRLDTVVIP